MSATNGGPEDPLVKALRKKTNYQAERIDDLEKTIQSLEADVQMLLNEIVEGDST